MRNLDWKDNAALYTAAAKAAPGSAKVHLNLSSVHINAGKLDEASSDVQEALRIYPDYPSAMEAYGLIKCWKGDCWAGTQLLKKALSMSTRAGEPFYDFMAVNYAAALIQTDRTDEALELLNREIAQSPSYSRAWSNRALIRHKRDDMEGARADANVALKLDPDNMQAKNILRALKAGMLFANPR